MMTRVIFVRLTGLIVTCAVASIAVFGAVHAAPGDPVSFLFKGRQPSPEQLASVRAYYHLDDSALEQYGRWAGKLVRGDLGESIVAQSSVASLIDSRLSTTLLLVAMAALWTVVFGIGLGALAARRRGAVDDGIMAATTLGVATPSFVVAAILIALFSVGLGWFPVSGAGSGFGDRVYHLFLPSVAVSISLVGFVARTTRTAVRSELGRDHVMTSTARGLRGGLIFRRHVFRNALGPISAVTGLAIANLVAGTVIVETAFGLNGLGSLLIQSVLNGDFPVVQAVVLILVVTFVVVNTVADLIAAAIDPRLRSRGAT